MNKLLIILSVLLLFSCSEEEQPPAEKVYDIRELGTLATTEYTYGKILQLNDDKEWYKLGDRKILISVKAKAKAGVDLTKMTEQDIVEKDDKTIQLTLPAPEIVSFDMNPNDIRTEMQDVNGLRTNFSQEEKVKIMQLGEESIRTEMKESNILSDARKNARVFLTDFYKDMGYEQVIIEFKPSEDGKK